MTKIYIGENTVLKGDITVGSDCSFWHNAVIRADSGYIHIGNSVNIQDLVMIHTGFNGYNVTIGNNVTIGHSAIIHGCTIKDESLIGMGAIIMNGAEIGFRCIVGAGALVTENKKFEDGSLIIGSPAKAVRKLTDKEIEGIHQNALLYVKEAQKELNPADF
jgi:carbonic anhydrase/acetyltransferase-like protein (isoleucine patch superfamily)